MNIKKYILGLGLLMAGNAVMAQGLEGIIVERYYQANAADAQYTVDQGYTYPLAEGAVTYRVYVDMAAGYKFVQMFGTATQNLTFGTTTTFYNDENYDSQTAPTTSALNTKKHTAMLDSWITAGGAAASKVGVPKDEDTDGSIANPQPQGILGNTLGGCFGLQITGASGKDGLLASSGTTYTTPNVLGMSGSILNALVAGNALSSITVSNGSIAALGGIVGATSSNKVLVGQFTTSGTFTFALNIQLLSPTGTAVNYVHSNPTSGQLTNSTLTRTAGGVPTVSIASSDADNTICAGTSVTFTATPVNGGTPSYQWKLNGTNVGTNAATYTNAALANNDAVSVVMTAGGCDASGSATSNSVNTTVNSLSNYYADADGDTYGAGTATSSCTNPGAGYVTNNTDCNDASASVHPGATEVCDGIDNDCASGADNGLTFTNYYADADGDTYGAGTATSACSNPGAGYATTNTDCNDASASIHPGAIEVCDGIDNDCNAGADNGLTFINYYADADGDTYGSGTATSACSNPGAGYATSNTDCNDASASVHPGATEVCGNSIDEDCSGADLSCSSGGLTAITLSNISVFGVGTQSSVNVNLAAGTNTVESAGNGLDVWYQFTAAQPAVRIALTGSSSVADDNDLALYQSPTTTGVQLVPLVTENDVHPGNVGTLNADGGSETMFYSNLTVGQVYYILARNNNSTPGTAALRVAYIRGGAMDIAAYTNNTNIYTNNCQNFKVAFRTNATGYTVNRWASSNISGVPDYVYAIPTGTVVQLGRIFSANFTNAAQTKYVTVDVAYSMQDAFGNNNEFTVVGNTLGTFTMSPEAALQVRSTDQCPVYKTVSGSIASDRGVCGVRNYNWQFTQVLPTAGIPLSIDGALSASRILPLSAVAGIANGQKYDVKVRAKHMDNATYSEFNSSANCVRTVGSAGMPVAQDAIISEAVQLSQGTFAVYPNPNTGSEVVLYANDFEGAVNVQIMDASGRIIKSDKWIVEGAGSRMINFNETLSTGMYTIRLNDGAQTQAIKMVVVR
jgi:hypothetical protein